MRHYLIFFLLLLSLPLHANTKESIQQQMRLAQGYFDTKQYDQARSIYEELLESKELQPWQEEFIIFNIGNTYLAQDLWDQALSRFNEIQVSSHTNPILARNLKFNHIFATLKETERQILSLNEADTQFLDSANELIETLKLALVNLEDVKKQDCAIAALKGGTTNVNEHECYSETTFKPMTAHIKVLTTDLITRINSYERARFSFLEEIALLHNLNQSIYKMSLILSPEIPVDIKAQYIKEEIDDRKTELSDWQRVYQTLAKLSEKEKKEKGITKDTEAEYKKGIDTLSESLKALQTNDLTSSEKLLTQARDTLKTFLLQVLSGNQLQSILKMLLIDYESALLMRPLIELPLLGLQASLEEAAAAVPEKNDRVLSQITLAKKTLQQSLGYIQKNKRKTARTFLRESFYAVQDALEFLEAKENPSSIDILKKGIEKQKQGEQIVMMVKDQVLPLEGISSELQSSIIPVQHAPIVAVKEFITQVLREQKIDFSQTGQDLEKACQDKPWDEVIPLFQQGKDSATKALEIVKEPQPNWRFVTQLQQSTLVSWKMALQKMEAHQAEAKQQKQQQQNQPQGPKPASTEHVLKYLDQMLQDDKVQVISHPPENKQELKPW